MKLTKKLDSLADNISYIKDKMSDLYLGCDDIYHLLYALEDEHKSLKKFIGANKLREFYEYYQGVYKKL